MAPGRAETQRSRETVGLVPPSVSRCRKPARGARNCLRRSTFSVHQHETKAHACRQNAHVLTITPTFSSLPRSRAILFDQKHFLCICCPPSDDFQTSPVAWWRADGESEQNLFRKDSVWSQQSCSLRSGSRKLSWKPGVK